MSVQQDRERLVEQTAQRFNISKEEAVKRLKLLYESGILELGSPEDPAQQRRIDSFLAMDSEKAEASIAYERVFKQCLGSKELVRQFDRLNYSNLGKALRMGNERGIQRHIDAFAKHIVNPIWERLNKLEADA